MARKDWWKAKCAELARESEYYRVNRDLSGHAYLDMLEQKNELVTKNLQQAERIKELEAERDALKAEYEERINWLIGERDALKEELSATQKGFLKRGETISALAMQNQQMREALESIRRYGLDTLSGRTDGPDDRAWQRAGVNEMTKRAHITLPDLSTEIIRKHDAVVLRKAADWFDDNIERRLETWQAQELRRMAAELEKP